MCLGIKYINNKCAHVSEPLSSKASLYNVSPMFSVWAQEDDRSG